MLTPLRLPAMRAVKVICSLPSQPELVPGGVANNKSEAIFTDLSLEGVEFDGSALIFNGFVNSGSRPVKLTASGPITNLSVRIEVVDWLGESRVCRFLSPNDHASIKLCYMPLSLVRNYAPEG